MHMRISHCLPVW